MLQALLLTVACLAALKVSVQTAWILGYHVRGALENDTLIYFTVGRGMLNGLQPYRDLFESKPPGMFLLAALSLLLTQGPLLITVADVVALLLPPALLAMVPWWTDSDLRRAEKCALSVIAFTAAMMLMLYVEERAGPAQTEVFGSFFAMLYMLNVARTSTTRSSLLTNSLLLLAAIGMKEPFLLTAFAGVLLVTRGLRQFIADFVLPLGIAACLGGLALLLLGVWTEYINSYLPTMLAKRVTSNPVEPFFIRGFSVAKVLYNLTVVYANPLFGILIATLWALFPILKVRDSRPVSVALVLCGACLGYALLRFTWVLSVFFYAVSFFQAEWDGVFVGGKIAEYLGLLIAFAVVLYFQHRRRLAGATLVALGATLPVSAAVGAAGYALNHWAFAGPVYFALLVVAVRHALSNERNPLILGAIAIITVIAGLASHPSSEHENYLTYRLQYSEASQRSLVERFDSLLDSCGFDRYTGVGVFESLAFARHSPIGPIFVPEFNKYLSPNHPLFQETRTNITNATKVAVVRDGSAMDDLHGDEVMALFSSEAPECARNFLPLPGLKVLFRRS